MKKERSYKRFLTVKVDLKKLRKDVDDAFAVRTDKQRIVERKERELLKAGRDIDNANESLLILQVVAKKTQEQLEYRVSELVTLALSIFPNPYEFKLTYQIKRNKTEANLWFTRDGHQLKPIDETGHGPVDVGGFALKVAVWSMTNGKYDNVVWMDEPFKNINDKTRQLHIKAVNMVKKICDKLKIQFIVVSQLPEFEDVADKVFEVTKKGEKSIIKEV